MTYWVFTTSADAGAAQAACTAALPKDTVDGSIAPVQITDKWADVVATIDGRFGFPACPYVKAPTAATAMDDSSFESLIAPPVVAAVSNVVSNVTSDVVHAL